MRRFELRSEKMCECLGAKGAGGGGYIPGEGACVKVAGSMAHLGTWDCSVEGERVQQGPGHA